MSILFKRLTLKGTTLRSRTVEYQSDLLGRFEQYALGLIKEGKMKIEVHEVFPWTEVIKATKEMEANKNSGKVSINSSWRYGCGLIVRLCLKSPSNRRNICRNVDLKRPLKRSEKGRTG